MILRKLLLGFVIGALLALGILILLQYLVDPYDYFGIPKITGINSEKPFLYENARLSKPKIISRNKPLGVFLGGSTIEGGLDPEHPELNKVGSVYNAALPSGRFYESYRMLQHSIASNDIKLAVVSLDFINWVGFKEIKASTFNESLLATSFNEQHNTVDSIRRAALKHIFNPRLLGNGLVTLNYQDNRVLRQGTSYLRFPVHWYKKNGQRSHISSTRYGIAYKGFDVPFRKYISRQSKRLKEIDHTNPFPAKFDGYDYFDLINQFIHLAKKHQFRLIFVMPPCHTSILETYYQTGVWNEFEYFKMKIAEQIKKANNDFQVETPVYDFCVYDKNNAEIIFNRSNQMVPPTTFWDPLHLTSKTGDKVISIILGNTEPIGRYGVNLLTIPDIKMHLKNEMSSRRRLKDELPNEFKSIKLLTQTSVD